MPFFYFGVKKEFDKIMVVFVCDALNSINRISPKVKKVLQLFRLLQIHNATFVKVNKATINMLQLIQPYVAYGYDYTIRGLVYKRGFAKIRHRPGAISRIPIMSNDFIEKHLGKYKIQTIEDIVHEIYTVGPHFREVSNFLWPFKLNCPRGGYRLRKRRHFNEGGSYGNWENYINNFFNNTILLCIHDFLKKFRNFILRPDPLDTRNTLAKNKLGLTQCFKMQVYLNIDFAT
ncbi:60S ribosomal protein L7 [Reticulomyxa filosa]|uniref:60S ribosomal protein L7 n=1 Tax=Reticulomyxa filosa TaxID=46433 RepID=X6MGQ7_RETFI|nr:60S ribosomal protein L7 [Reticulomyxa filosa]|eukprot:ETO12831.1 60S ribosomal protein L7 [Reticulomyxa filosa]